MKSDFWQKILDRIGRRHETTGDFDFAEETLRATRDHIAKDFANPQREGCPAYGAVFNSFRSGKIPQGEDRAHILSCSECFNEYQIQLAEYRAENRVPERAGGLAWWPRIAIPSLAFGLLFVAIAVTIWKFSAGFRGDENALSQSITAVGSPSPLPSPMVSNSVNADQNKPEEDESQKQSTNSMIAVNRVTIDFEQAIALRRLAPQQSEIISLSPTLYALLIKLPEESPKGSYTVALNNAFGKSVRSKITASTNGKRVRVTFNLSGLDSGGYSICVTREQEVPSCLPVTIRAR